MFILAAHRKFLLLRRQTLEAMSAEVIDDPRLRGRRFVFEDRADAGRALATVLRESMPGDAVVLAIPSGGIPVAAAIARELDWPMDLVVVRKLQIPFNPEAGFGAVTMSGEMFLNRRLMADLALTADEIEAAREKALAEGRSRQRALLGDRPRQPLERRTAVLVDDGLASGYTMLAALAQVRKENPTRVVVAVPTGADRTVLMVAEEADLLVCLNVRGGTFAVADAYRNWYDLTEEEASAALRSVR